MHAPHVRAPPVCKRPFPRSCRAPKESSHPPCARLRTSEFDRTIKSTEQGYAKLKRNSAILLESFNQQSDELAKQQSAAPPAAQGRLEGQSKSRQLRASREQLEEEKQPPTKAITSAQRFSNKYQDYDGVGRS